MDDARDEIRRVIDQRLAAIARRDAEAAVAVLAPEVVVFEMVPPLALAPGAARNAEGFAAWLAGFEHIHVEMRDLTIEAEGATGFAHSLHHLQGTRIGGETMS